MLIDDLVTTIFPADCRCCEGPLEQASVVPVCRACVGRVLRNTMAACSRCGEAINLDLDLEDARFAGMLAEGFLCRECRLAAPEFARAVHYASYDGEIRSLIRLLKFERVRGVARLLGQQMAEAVLQLEGVAANDLLVIAVPLFKERERQRGYNQSVLLADEALRRLKTTRPQWKLTAAHTALERRKSTESSFVLSRKGRRRNLSGAFRVTGDVRGREVLLIDDILTSGATARECARVLMRAGAEKVWVATLARAQKQFVRRQHEDAGALVAKWDLAAVPGSNTESLAAPE
jgi:ComF family protein